MLLSTYNILLWIINSFPNYTYSIFPFIKELETQYSLNIGWNFLIYWILIYILSFLIYSKNQNNSKFLTIYIATPIHELYHLLWAFITGAKIYSVKLITSREEREQGILWYVKTWQPLTSSLSLFSAILWNLGIFTTVLRFLLQPIISLAPIIFWGIFYIISLFLIFDIPLFNFQQFSNLFLSSSTGFETLNISFIQGIFIFFSSLIFVLTSIPSYWKDWFWDINNVKYQLFLFIIISLFITNLTFVLFTKFILLYLVIILIFQTCLYLITSLLNLWFRNK